MGAIIDYRGKTPKKSVFGVPLVTAKVVKNGRILESPREYISFEDYDNWMIRGIPKSGDVVITTEAPLGEVAQLDDRKVALAQRLITLRGKPGLMDNTFLKFMLQSPIVQHGLHSRSTGTTVLGIKQSELRKVELIVPPIEEQRSIATVLGSLDDKIELNRRMNETLEGIARAIFKSWFVDFDPVWAKMEGRDYPLDAETMALFPDHFEESELGEIPAGWEVGTVGDDFNITMGQSPPGSTYNEDGIGPPFYQGRRDFGFRYPTQRIFCSAPKRMADSGDSLVSVRAPVGDVNMAIESCCIGRGVATVRYKEGSRSYTYYAMKSLRTIFDRFEAEGTVFGSLNKRDFHGLDFILPLFDVVNAFEKKTFPIDQMIENNEIESQTLKELRDTLLPKLISGELRVPEVEDMI